jgi:peptide/nickel transport system substrate-binding protein
MPSSPFIARLKAPAALALLALGACSIAQAQTPAQIVVAQPADIRSTNPGVNRDNTTDGVVLNMVEGLVGYHENGSVGPLLAKSITISPDGLTYTFKLRTGIKFHNGDAGALRRAMNGEDGMAEFLEVTTMVD